METVIEKKSKGIPIFGIFFILLGTGIFLSKLHLFAYGWKTVFWICMAVVGIMSVIQAYIVRRRGTVFWGSLLFFASVAILVHRFELIDFIPLDIPATFSLALGLSFLMMYLYDPRKIGVLIPVLFFGGYGILYYLWWWDIIDWFEMKDYIHLYWPALIILFGLTLIFRRR